MPSTTFCLFCEETLLPENQTHDQSGHGSVEKIYQYLADHPDLNLPLFDSNRLCDVCWEALLNLGEAI